MKKLLATIGIILSIGLVPAITQAQTDFGIRGGVNFATLSNLEGEVGYRIGFLAGIYMNYQIPNSQFSIQPEVLYTQKGAEDSFTNEAGQEVTQTLKLGYIEIPVLLKYNFNTSGNITPHVYVGPYLGINMNAEIEREGGEEPGTTDISEDTKNIDFGAVAGIGVNIQRFNLGVRYSLGLIPIPEDEDADAKNRVISIVVGYTF